MQKMPTKEPSLWAQLIELINNNKLEINAALFAAVVAFIRVIYDRGGKRQLLLESLLCGVISMALSTGLEYLGTSKELAPLIGGMVGFVGVDRLRSLAERFLGRKADGGRDYYDDR